MPFKRPLILVGVAVTLAALNAVSAADRPRVHVMTVALPGGGIEQIRYTGDKAPRVLMRDAVAPGRGVSLLDAAFGEDSPFAMVDRVSMMMDAQADAMMRQAQMMMTRAPSMQGKLQDAALANVPAGATSYTMISSSTGRGTCTRSVSITSTGAGTAPQVIRKSTGDCGSAAAATAPTALHEAAIRQGAGSTPSASSSI